MEDKMASYIISSHGQAIYENNSSTTIPNDTTVHFYTPFGQEMPNEQGFQIQTALSQGNEPPVKTVALWNTGTQQPGINLIGDMKLFKSGIVRLDPSGNSEVISNLGANQLISLSYALEEIRKRESNGHIDVHCLFCLTP